MMDRFRPSLRDERGFTIVEVMVAAMVLLVGVLGTVQVVNVANQRTVVDQGREAATNVAREVVEAVNSVPYDALTPTGVTAALQAVPGLATQGAGWTLKRRGTDFTVTATACTIDDKVDGYRAPSATGTYCPESNQTDGTKSQDRNGDDFRRVAVTVSWTKGNVTRTVRQSTVVNNPGDAAGPAVTALTSSIPSPITSSTATSVTFTATVTGPPKTTAATKVKFFVDGVEKGVATGGPTSWSFAWSGIDKLPDATYIISMQAYDASGRSRGARIMRMVLDRNAAPPPSVDVGRNVRLTTGGISVVDVEWPASSDPDVFGYRVYRSANGVVKKVCETSMEPGRYGIDWVSYSFDQDYLSCVDTSPVSSNTNLFYGVTALDHDPVTGAVRETTGYAFKQVVSPVQPRSVGSSVVTRDADGHVVLDWNQAKNGSVAGFYRIYRDGTALSNRYDRTVGNETLWTDLNSAPGTTHTYYVMAVDASTLGESAASPAVTG